MSSSLNTTPRTTDSKCFIFLWKSHNYIQELRRTIVKMVNFQAIFITLCPRRKEGQLNMPKVPFWEKSVHSQASSAEQAALEVSSILHWGSGFFLEPLQNLPHTKPSKAKEKTIKSQRRSQRRNPRDPYFGDMYKAYNLALGNHFYLSTHICLKPFELPKPHILGFHFSFPVGDAFGSWGTCYIHFPGLRKTDMTHSTWLHGKEHIL